MSLQGVFITGTDTGVGKTVVASVVLVALRRTGLDAVPMKPVQTGCRRRAGGWRAPDLEFCLRAAGLRPGAPEQKWMAPYCFGPACSPHLAAERAGVRISPDRIRTCFAQLADKHEFVVVEGAGGVLVPLGGGRTMADLMRKLRLPVLLVARPGLGTINHTLLSLRELERSGVEVLGVVLNAAGLGKAGWIERSNRTTIERMSGTPVLGYLPYQVPGAQRLQAESLGPLLARLQARGAGC